MYISHYLSSILQIETKIRKINRTQFKQSPTCFENSITFLFLSSNSLQSTLFLNEKIKWNVCLIENDDQRNYEKTLNTGVLLCFVLFSFLLFFVYFECRFDVEIDLDRSVGDIEERITNPFETFFSRISCRRIRRNVCISSCVIGFIQFQNNFINKNSALINKTVKHLIRRLC